MSISFDLQRHRVGPDRAGAGAAVIGVAIAVKLPEITRWLAGGSAATASETAGNGFAGTMVLLVIGLVTLLCAGLIVRASASEER